MRRSTLAILIVLAALLALFVYSTRGLGKYSCEVCMEFGGRQQCRTARGSTVEEAQRAATDNACAFLASGMTDGIQCGRTPPQSVNCR